MSSDVQPSLIDVLPRPSTMSIDENVTQATELVTQTQENVRSVAPKVVTAADRKNEKRKAARTTNTTSRQQHESDEDNAVKATQLTTNLLTVRKHQDDLLATHRREAAARISASQQKRIPMPNERDEGHKRVAREKEVQHDAVAPTTPGDSPGSSPGRPQPEGGSPQRFR